MQLCETGAIETPLLQVTVTAAGYRNLMHRNSQREPTVESCVSLASVRPTQPDIHESPTA